MTAAVRSARIAKTPSKIAATTIVPATKYKISVPEASSFRGGVRCPRAVTMAVCHPRLRARSVNAIDRASRERNFVSTAQSSSARARAAFLGLLASITLNVLGCDTYVPPPEFEDANLINGEYDPAAGALSVAFNRPIAGETLQIELRLDRRSREGDLCGAVDAAIGCRREATRVLGPCVADGSKAERLDDGARYTCEGGAIALDTAEKTLRLEPLARLIPYERYVLIVDAGLTDRDGRDRGSPLELIFQVKGDLPRAPTDFEQGMFWAVVETFEPLSAQFHFFFWLAVKQETGEIRAFAADADPVDPNEDPKVNRNPAEWTSDPNAPSGSALRASGQVADTQDGRVIRVYPFLLQVSVPPVDAVGAEVGARISMAELPNVPGGVREVIEGTLTAPEIFLGIGDERAALGPGRGTITLIRLREEETPSLESILPAGATLADIENAFDN